MREIDPTEIRSAARTELFAAVGRPATTTETLRNLALLRRITIDTIATRINSPAWRVERVLNSRATPRAGELEAIAAALGVVLTAERGR